MKNLLKLQLRNAYKSKLFYVCMIIVVLMNILLFITGLEEQTKLMPKIVSIFSTGLDMVLVIYVVLFSSEDINENTAKNIISRGYTKNELLISKYIVSLLGVFAINFALILLSIIMYIKYGIGFESSMLLVILVSIIGIVIETVLYASVSFILEKHSISILTCLFAPSIISFALSIIGNKINVDISKYWYNNLASNYIASPTTNNLIISIIGYLIYFVVIVFVTMNLIKEKEIK